MHADQPFALLITWTCYGTWLPGDARGHVSNTLHPEGGYQPKQNVAGAPIAGGDAVLRERAQSLQKQSTVWLTEPQAVCAAHALVEASLRRGWRILRGAIMANHIHVVVADCPNNGPAVRRILKGTSQAALSKRAGSGCRWWTAGGSDRYKNDHCAIDAAVQYVARQARMLVEIVDMQVRVAEGPPG